MMMPVPPSVILAIVAKILLYLLFPLYYPVSEQVFQAAPHLLEGK